MRKLQLNKEYTYQSICEEMEWKVYSGGTSRQAQIKAIEDSYEFYHPINKKTHKPKKSYIFTSEKKEIELNTWGGKRDGSGRKEILVDEATGLICNFIINEYNHNVYYKNGNISQIYYTNDAICKSFGLYNNIYNLDKDVQKKISEIAYDEIISMLTVRRKIIIDNRLNNYDFIKEATHGLLIYVGKEKGEWFRCDEKLQEYDSLVAQYLMEHKFYHPGQVAKAKLWGDMIEYVINHMESPKIGGRNITKLLKCNKITLEPNTDFNQLLSKNDVHKYKIAINNYVVESIFKSCEKKAMRDYAIDEIYDNDVFENKMEHYKYIINNCIKLL